MDLTAEITRPITPTAVPGEVAPDLVARVLAAGGSIHDSDAVAARLRADPAALAAWVSDAFADPDVGGVHTDLAMVVRAIGAAEIARRIGVSRATVHKAFSPGREPSLQLTLRILAAMGLTLTVRRKRTRKRVAAA